jgi:hypothetical protein
MEELSWQKKTFQNEKTKIFFGTFLFFLSRKDFLFVAV